MQGELHGGRRAAGDARFLYDNECLWGSPIVLEEATAGGPDGRTGGWARRATRGQLEAAEAA